MPDIHRYFVTTGARFDNVLCLALGEVVTALMNFDAVRLPYAISIIMDNVKKILKLILRY